VGALNSAQIFGTFVPVEEPSTASISEVTGRSVDRVELQFPNHQHQACGWISSGGWLSDVGLAGEPPAPPAAVTKLPAI
jgi:hypothetical protein